MWGRRNNCHITEKDMLKKRINVNAFFMKP